MTHPAIQGGKVAVVTGGASGIGFAAARHFGEAGMTVIIADLPGSKLDAAVVALTGEGINAHACATDVTDPVEVRAARDVAARYGEVTVVMSNAGREGGGSLFADANIWRQTLKTNLWGGVNVAQAFLPAMIASESAGAIIFTGSKQGITLPPGDTAYNVSKAGLRALAESVSHELVTATGDRVTAHLLIPGFTYTGFTRAKGATERPEGAWTPEQVVDELVHGMDKGRFYILCPDNEVDRATDLKRMAWGMGDILEDRPALSRWHPDHAAEFADYMKPDD